MYVLANQSLDDTERGGGGFGSTGGFGEKRNSELAPGVAQQKQRTQ